MEFHCLWKCMTMGYLPFKKQTQACARECVCVCVCVAGGAENVLL